MPLVSDSGLPQPPNWPEFRYHLARLESLEPGAQLSALSALSHGVAKRPELVESVFRKVLSIFENGRFNQEALDSALCFLVRYRVDHPKVVELVQSILQSGHCSDELYSGLAHAVIAFLPIRTDSSSEVLLQSILLESDPSRALRSFSMLYSKLESVELPKAQLIAKSVLSLQGVRDRLELLLVLESECFDDTTSTALLHRRRYLDWLKKLAEGDKPEQRDEERHLSEILSEAAVQIEARLAGNFSAVQVSAIQHIMREHSFSPREWINCEIAQRRVVVLGLCSAFYQKKDPYERLANDLVVLAKQGIITHLAIPSLQKDQAAIQRGDFSNRLDLTGGGEQLDRPRDRLAAERTDRFLEAVRGYLKIVCYYGHERIERGLEITQGEEAAAIMQSYQSSECNGIVVLNGDMLCSKVPLLDGTRLDRSFFGPELLDRVGKDNVSIALYLDQSRKELEIGEAAALKLPQLYECGAVRGSFALNLAATPFATLPHPNYPDSQMEDAFDAIICRVHGDGDTSQKAVSPPKAKLPLQL